MRANIEEYKAVEQAAMNFVKSVSEGNSSYAKKLFIDEAVLFGFLDGKLEHGSIQQFYHNVDTVDAGDKFKARVDVIDVEETLSVVRVLEEKWGGRIDFTDYLLQTRYLSFHRLPVFQFPEEHYHLPISWEYHKTWCTRQPPTLFPYHRYQSCLFPQ